MIITQPKKPVIYLISVCIGGCFLLVGYWLYTIISSPASLLSFFIVCLLLALLLFIAILLATSYISVQAGDNKLTVHYLLLGKSKSYALSSLTDVEEVKINTFQNKEFRQLIIRFGEEKISLNNQVYTNYDSLKNYLQQKKPGSRNKLSRR